MEPKLFYRVAHRKTQQGLWYDFKGNYTGLIHNDFSFCTNHDLMMPFDAELVGWLSATDTIEELFKWFPHEDIQKLQKYGYAIMVYESADYKYHNNHWLIRQNSSRLLHLDQQFLPTEYCNHVIA